nr:MAG TPA: hypothetical protein [Bacteriophage sp.]
MGEVVLMVRRLEQEQEPEEAQKCFSKLKCYKKYKYLFL